MRFPLCSFIRSRFQKPQFPRLLVVDSGEVSSRILLRPSARFSLDELLSAQKDARTDLTQIDDQQPEEIERFRKQERMND